VKKNIMLHIGFIAIVFCCMIVLGATRLNKMNEKQSRKFYSEDAKSFDIYNCEEENYWDDNLKNHVDYILYNTLDDPDEDIRGVYYSGKVELVPMTEGRFFKENEYESEPCAVLGKNKVKYAVEENGQRYYRYGDINYKVIGVMGEKIPTRIDDLVFIDFKTSLEETSVNSYYVIDGKSQKYLEQILDRLSATMAYPGEISYSVPLEGNGVSWLFEKQRVTKTMYGIMLAIFLIATIMMTNLWFDKKRKTIGIFQMIGLSKRNIIFELIKDYFKIVGTAFVVGECLSVIFVSLMDTWGMTGTDFLFTALISIGFGTVSLLQSVIKVMRMQISTVMRG